MDGLTCLSRLMIEAPLPVVIVSSQTLEGAETTLEALHLGAVEVVAKPEGTVSLSIDRIRPMLVEKVRAAAKARLRPTLRLTDRVRHRIGGTTGAAGSAGKAETAASLWCDRLNRMNKVGSGAGADRRIDRRPAGAGGCSDRPARRSALARSGGPAHAGDIHQRLRPAARPHLRPYRQGGPASHRPAARPCPYSPGRRRHDRGAAPRRTDRLAGAGLPGPSLASFG